MGRSPDISQPDWSINATIGIKSAGFNLIIESSDPIGASELSQLLGIEKIESC